jgi:2-polyprenyl-3-methyl-5-hydroxy-6-metoxy-1,4-benzoquinol methylase
MIGLKLLRSLRPRRPAPTLLVPAAPSRADRSPEPEPEPVLRLDFPACVARAFPAEFPAAWSAVEQVMRACAGVDLAPLARRSPGLRGYDWGAYLRCSVVRMTRALHALRERGVAAGRVLDFGSYFGNFSLMCAAAGYAVDALDSYQEYGEALAPFVRLLREAGAQVRDFAAEGFDLGRLPAGSYDAVLCMGVIEHIPHTPRPVLEAVRRVLKPGGVLVLDTPNLAYLYNRQKLVRGESLLCPIALQYYTELPYEGHHREYTLAEVGWMLGQLGQEEVALETFCYSVYQAEALTGEALENYRHMLLDASAAEVILAVSRKPHR